MYYKPELGIIGNIKHLFEENNKTNAKASYAGGKASYAAGAAEELKETEALTLELAADHEARICMMELGVN